MKNEKIKFIWKNEIFLIVFMVVIIVINFFCLKTVQKNLRIYKKNSNWHDYIENSNNKVNFLFVGDSHVEGGINPNFINDAYNLGYSGENYIETYFKLKNIIENDKTEINNIIFELDLNTLYKKNNSFKHINYYIHFVPLNIIAKYRNENIAYSWFKSKIYLFGNGNEIITSLFHLYKDISIDRGYVKNSKNLIKLTDNDSLKTKDKFNNKKINKDLLIYLLKTIKIAKDNNINIFFIKYPMTKAYNNGIKESNRSRKEYYEIIFNRINNVFPNLKYNKLDYYDLFFENDEYFKDLSHLNLTGAEALSKQINIDLNKNNQ